MTKIKRGLGRGLDVLLAGSADSNSKQVDYKEGLRELPIDLIQKGKYQPRHGMDQDSLRDLANSIAAQGVVQPIIVRPIDNERFEIIAGERRWRATQMTQYETIPAIVRDISDSEVLSIALIENIQREDLNALDEAIAIGRLISEFSMTHQETADAIGRSRTAVSNSLRLLDLNDEVKQMLHARNLEMGHARALLGLKGKMQTDAAHVVVAKGFSVRDTERYVKTILKKQDAEIIEKRVTNPDVIRLQNKLAETLGALVDIKNSANGKGKLIISYNNLDELDGILSHIN